MWGKGLQAISHQAIFQHQLGVSHVWLCDSVDYSPPGSSVHRILQARILECVAILLSRGSSRPRDLTQVSCIAGGFFTFWTTKEAPVLTQPTQREKASDSTGIGISPKRPLTSYFQMPGINSRLPPVLFANYSWGSHHTLLRCVPDD